MCWVFSFTGLAQDAVADKTRAVGGTLKCPVCNGLPLTESPSEFARSMLEEVRAQVRAGKSEAEIQAFFVSRYGPSVLLEPPFSGVTLLVWLLPLAAVGLGGWGLYGYLRRASRAQPDEAVDPALLERVRHIREGQS
ncbi:MAG: cytochrome c-type biogenesis protein CcmH [Pleurocapsa sp. SU_196_0]|nr:cytochrome c-type biogenesis protein CcmH [Pleurocapsa sp. SU_196_0]